MDLMKNIENHKLVPVIKLDNADHAVSLAEALCSGGLPVAEVTFRTTAARASIEHMHKAFPEMLIGAGTITTTDQAKQAVDAGACFLVSAGFSRKVTEYAVDNNIPIFPGVCTPTELMLLLEYDLTVAKFFPAQQYGGLNTIKALAAPFPQMRFMPTGGIHAGNILDYLAFDKIVACGGSWMVKDTLINDGEFDKIRAFTQEAVSLIHGEA